MSKKNNNTAYLLLGLAAFLILQQRRPAAAPPYNNYPQAPPAPPRSNAQAFAAWAAAMVHLYGNVSSLWQPGGPFYQFPANEIYDAVGNNPIPDYDNPYLTGGGWA